MDPRIQMTIFPCLALFLLLWSQVPGVQGQEFQFGFCHVQGVKLQVLRKAFGTLRDTVQAQDNTTSVRLLRKEILQNISDAESCYFIRALLKFYLKAVFRNYYRQASELRLRRALSTLTNNFLALASALQPREEDKVFSLAESARRRFLQVQGAFQQLDVEAALIKAIGEVDILLTWMEKYYQR
ncbi:interleukin-24 [Echinops telfairi]|uniref:Interleukin family protein n=1 Tax=Echinops telfairi TaxID=9371 RepID=A0ABM0IHI1_ECHTE|nr:interleukin-24 [Echinops telfairi]